MFSRLMTDAQREALAQREAAMSAMEAQRKTAGWPPYVMADLLSEATGKTIELRINPILNHSEDFGDKVVHSPTYQIGIIDEFGDFARFATMNITSVQPKSGGGDFGISACPDALSNLTKAGLTNRLMPWKSRTASATLKTSETGEFIGDMTPRLAMQTMINTLGLVDKVNKSTAHPRIASSNSSEKGR